MAEIYWNDALYQPSAYHMSEIYVTNKVHDPNTPTFLEALTNVMDDNIFKLVKSNTYYVVPRISSGKLPVYLST